MVINRLFEKMAKLFLGQDVTLALMLLRSISEAIKKGGVDGVARIIYQQLPANWRAPRGPATEAEFVELVQAGQLFLSKVQAVFKTV